MCGFVGFWSFTALSYDGVSILNSMSSAIYHRGPDEGHIWIDMENGVGLAHRRLSIVDLSDAGKQPMLSENKRYVIAFNGEIYNFEDIRSELINLNMAPVWKGHSDTEVILAAIVAWGIEAALKKFTGMFAFAVWDRENRALTLARDRFGEKPLYYTWIGHTLIFGSELKALCCHPLLNNRKINLNALHLYMRYNNIPAPFTIYEGINKLLPAHFVQYTYGQQSNQPIAYWALERIITSSRAHPFKGGDAEAVSCVEKSLRAVIAKQMVADVPLGAFLSGGIDSSTIVALMQTQSSRPIKTFTIGFHEEAMDEAKHAKVVAAHLGTDHTEHYVTAQDALDVIPRLPHLYDEPFADSSQIPTYLVSALAKKHVTVSLSGDAGDELFGGYNRYFLAERLWNRLGWVPLAARAQISKMVMAVPPARWDNCVQGILKLLPSRFQYKNVGDKLHKLAGICEMPTKIDLYRCLISQWTDPSEIVLGGREPAGIIDHFENWPTGLNFTEQMMYLDTLMYLPGDILTKVDRAAMGVSLETRIPFLDHTLAELAWSLPLSMKIRDRQGKWLLRQILYQYVPQILIERPKQGFGVPIDQWLRGSLKDWACSLLEPARLHREGYFKVGTVQRYWEEHVSGKRNWQHRLWTLLMFQAWLEAEKI